MYDTMNTTQLTNKIFNALELTIDTYLTYDDLKECVEKELSYELNEDIKELEEDIIDEITDKIVEYYLCVLVPKNWNRSDRDVIYILNNN